MDNQTGLAAFETLGLDVGAEPVCFAGHQGHALLAHAHLAGLASIALQDDAWLLALGASSAMINHVLGRGRVPEFGKGNLFGVKAAIDQQVLTFGHRRIRRDCQDCDTQ